VDHLQPRGAEGGQQADDVGGHPAERRGMEFRQAGGMRRIATAILHVDDQQGGPPTHHRPVPCQRRVRHQAAPFIRPCRETVIAEHDQT